jgi:hypothetical protein
LQITPVDESLVAATTMPLFAAGTRHGPRNLANDPFGSLAVIASAGQRNSTHRKLVNLQRLRRTLKRDGQCFVGNGVNCMLSNLLSRDVNSTPLNLHA